MNIDKLDTLIAFIADRNAEERFDITKYHHTCGTPSCIIGWAYTLQTGNDKLEVPADITAWPRYGTDVMLKAATEYLSIERAQACEIACGWEYVTDYDAEDDADMAVWVDDPIPFETVVAYLNALKEDPYMTWQKFYDLGGS